MKVRIYTDANGRAFVGDDATGDPIEGVERVDLAITESGVVGTIRIVNPALDIRAAIERLTE